MLLICCIPDKCCIRLILKSSGSHDLLVKLNLLHLRRNSMLKMFCGMVPNFDAQGFRCITQKPVTGSYLQCIWPVNDPLNCVLANWKCHLLGQIRRSTTVVLQGIYNRQIFTVCKIISIVTVPHAQCWTKYSAKCVLPGVWLQRLTMFTKMNNLSTRMNTNNNATCEITTKSDSSIFLVFSQKQGLLD